MASPQIQGRATASGFHNITGPASRPLCIDLEGALIRTDIFLESLLHLARTRPLELLLVPFWLLHGRAFLRHQVVQRAAIDVAVLPYCAELVKWLRGQQEAGRKLVLVTAADSGIARRIAHHLDLFTEILSSNERSMLTTDDKVKHLQSQFGAQGFDYVGSSKADLPIWEQCHHAIIVCRSSKSSPSLGSVRPDLNNVSYITELRRPLLTLLLKAGRIHQWTKNLLVLVPILLSHQIDDVARLWHTALAFLAFCFCSSSVYIFNDLLDLEADRHHHSKRNRPFASGELPIWAGCLLLPCLLAATALCAWTLPPLFWLELGIYLFITLAYSFGLKRLVLVDVIILAGLYTIRITAGGAASSVPISKWLLGYSLFFFLSLALVKRVSELRTIRLANGSESKGRGYRADDLEQLMSFGSSSGYIAALVLALYINTPEVGILYSHPSALWFICVLHIYWISRVWLLTHRGEMHDDPVIFAIKDKMSYTIGALVLIILVMAL
jgi:4-hydroxybenzoate polyprenyltransferase